MREIKFRGKYEGEWWYVNAMDEPDMGEWEQFWAVVDRKTVGQSTGLRDKNGREIYEGDILMHPAPSLKQYRYAVIYQDLCTQFAGRFGGGSCTPLGAYALLSEKPWEIIGNVYDNPERLEA